MAYGAGGLRPDGSFNPHPSRGAGATRLTVFVPSDIVLFQSSPVPRGGCYCGALKRCESKPLAPLLRELPLNGRIQAVNRSPSRRMFVVAGVLM